MFLGRLQLNSGLPTTCARTDAEHTIVTGSGSERRTLREAQCFLSFPHTSVDVPVSMVEWKQRGSLRSSCLLFCDLCQAVVSRYPQSYVDISSGTSKGLTRSFVPFVGCQARLLRRRASSYCGFAERAHRLFGGGVPCSVATARKRQRPRGLPMRCARPFSVQVCTRSLLRRFGAGSMFLCRKSVVV